jgi:hypothetical protein
MKRPLVLALAAAATLFGATAANAARVDWSIGINVPPIGAVVVPAYAGYPGYAPPVGYAPPPRFVVAPPPIEYLPRPHIWLPPLPRLAWFDHGHERGYDHDRDYDHDHGHDHDGHGGWRR